MISHQSCTLVVLQALANINKFCMQACHVTNEVNYFKKSKITIYN